MVQIQIDLTEKANKKLERYTIYNECISKQVAVNQILEGLDLKKDKEEWWNKEEEGD